MKNNKALKVVGNIVYGILVLIVLLVLLVVILQRVSNNSISLAGFRIFNIISESMIPKYQIGDVLVSKDINPCDVKVGDDIVYEGRVDDFAGKIVTHEVVDIEQQDGKYLFHTKGLANDLEDPLVEQDQIRGKIIYKVQTLSIIAKVINNLFSFYFAIFVPIVLIIFMEIKRIIGDRKDDNEELKKDNKNIDDEINTEDEVKLEKRTKKEKKGKHVSKH